MVNNEVVTEFTDDGVEERKINPYTLVKKPVIPEVEYKWQRGFRRDSFGKYCKVFYPINSYISTYSFNCMNSLFHIDTYF